jgi:hypothetical protein
MSRNASGTWTQSIADFVTGTVIDSSDVNSLVDDIGAELTDSLSRSGKGGMLARLRGVDGTSALPAYAFTSETTIGLYRAGAADVRMSSNGTDLQKWTATSVLMYQALTAEKGLTVTNSTSNGAGTTSTGNGTGAGFVGTGGATGNGGTFTGGATSGAGVVATASAGNSNGVTATGQGTGAGVSATGGATGDGVRAVGGGGSASGIYATGGGTGVGGYFEAGTASTASEPTIAITAKSGHILLDATAPNKDEAFTNTLTPLNIPKAWAKITTNATTTPTVNAGFNVGAAAASGQTLTLEIVSDVNAASGVLVTNGLNTAYYIYNASCSGAQVTIKALDGGGATVPFSAVNFEATNGLVINVVVFGAQ